jgi:hypothetical protein
MKKTLTIFAILFFTIINYATALDTSTSIVIADYSNITTSIKDDPHQSGYAIAIYKRSDGLLFGDFTYASGTTEGFSGRLFDLNLDGKKISFKAKISSAYDSKEKRPTRELFEFRGKIQGNSLIGTMKVWNGYNIKEPEKVQQVKLKREKILTPISHDIHQEIFPKNAW